MMKEALEYFLIPDYSRGDRAQGVNPSFLGGIFVPVQSSGFKVQSFGDNSEP
jgi:hypothetical protein